MLLQLCCISAHRARERAHSRRRDSRLSKLADTLALLRCVAAGCCRLVGCVVFAVLTLRDLLLCVLKKTDREAEGMARLKAAVVRLVGADAPKEQLDVLATSLGDEVDLAALLAC
jgi:hypothetical protein